MDNEEQWKIQETDRLFRIRRTLLLLLRDRGYAVLDSEDDLSMSKEALREKLDYSNFKRDCLTTLKQRHNDSTDRIYAFLPENESGKKVGLPIIKLLASRMHRDEVKRAIVIATGFTAQAVQKVNAANQTKNVIIELFLENEFLVNLSRHALIPSATILSEEEARQVTVQYSIQKSEMHRIQMSDMMARYYGLVPGQVIKISRGSETAGIYSTYRICI